MKRLKWEIGSQVTVAFQRKATLGADPNEFPPAQYLGVITGYARNGGYTVLLEGSKIPFTVGEEQTDCILSLFAGIR